MTARERLDPPPQGTAWPLYSAHLISPLLPLAPRRRCPPAPPQEKALAAAAPKPSGQRSAAGAAAGAAALPPPPPGAGAPLALLSMSSRAAPLGPDPFARVAAALRANQTAAGGPEASQSGDDASGGTKKQKRSDGDATPTKKKKTKGAPAR